MPRDSAGGTDALSSRQLAAILAGLVIAGLAARLGYLHFLRAIEGVAWSDPDQYLRQADFLTRNGSWHWTIAAVQYRWGGRIWLLPPGYPVFLSLFSLVPFAYPASAAVAQAVLSSLLPVPMYVLGRCLHGQRCGLLCATVSACWFAAIGTPHVFVQEALFVPAFVAALAALAWGIENEAGARLFASAGLLWGGATLVRAMPLYFVPAACLLVVLTRVDRRAALPAAAAFLGGFLLVVTPYIVQISANQGQLVLVDNHAGILFDWTPGLAAPGVLDTARLIVNHATRPSRLVGPARALFQVTATRWLFYYGARQTAEAARWAERLVLVGNTIPFALLTLLAPIGLVLARSGRVAGLLAAWTLVAIALTALSANGGARYRDPFECVLIAGGAVVLVDRWRRPSLGSLSVAVVASTALGLVVLPQLPAAFAARAQYGLAAWSGPVAPHEAAATGPSGFHVLSKDGVVSFVVVPEQVQHGPLVLDAVLDGMPLEHQVITGPEPVTLRIGSEERGFRFVELSLASSTSGAPVPYRVRRAAP